MKNRLTYKIAEKASDMVNQEVYEYVKLTQQLVFA